MACSAFTLKATGAENLAVMSCPTPNLPSLGETSTLTRSMAFFGFFGLVGVGVGVTTGEGVTDGVGVGAATAGAATRAPTVARARARNFTSPVCVRGRPYGQPAVRL